MANKSGKVTVTPNTNAEKHGAVVIPANDSKHFAYEDGTPYFLLAFECDWLFALDYHNETDLPKSKHLLNLLKQNGINQIVMNVYTHDVSWKKDDLLKSHPEHEFGGSKDIFPFLGNNDKPDFSALNPGFFQKMDRTIALLADLNIDSHLMIYVWNKLVKWPDMYSDADNMYFDYVVKRYQAFPNVMFDISKEALFYGRADEKYILDRISRLRAQNHYNRLLSVHDFGFCKRNPDKVDFISTQDWSWDIYNQMSTATTMFKNKPVFNIEHGGYEESPYVTFTGSYTNAEVCLRRNYACLFAGTYSTYYWQGAACVITSYSIHYTKLYDSGKLATRQAIAFLGNPKRFIQSRQPNGHRHGATLLQQSYRHCRVETTKSQSGLSRITSYNVCYTKLLRTATRLAHKPIHHR